MSKETALQIVVKVVNNTAWPDRLVQILQAFGVSLHMYSMDPPAPSIIQRAAVIDKAINKAWKIWAENPVANILNTRSRPFVDFAHDLLLNFDRLVWQKDNAGQNGK